MNSLKNMLFITVVAVALCCSCSGGTATAEHSGGDTIKLKYAGHLTMIRHGAYTVVRLNDPWNKGRTLHTYILVPDSLNNSSSEKLDALKEEYPSAETVITPIKRAVVTTSVHCALIMRLGKGDAIKGVCDIKYINIPQIQALCNKGVITDCGNGTTPTLEKIISANADAILISPFQNSGGYGRLHEWGRPIIETADYMETSALGRAEWMKLYGMLFGAEHQADSIFNSVENNYNKLKTMAQKAETRPSVIIDKVNGPVWYVPAGKSTIGKIIADANASYAFSSDSSSGSLPLTFETVLNKAGNADIWMFRYGSKQAATYSSLLSENQGYAMLKSFKNKRAYGCNTASIGNRFYEDTPFSPDLLLRDFIIIAHPDIKLGKPKYFQPIK